MPIFSKDDLFYYYYFFSPSSLWESVGYFFFAFLLLLFFGAWETREKWLRLRGVVGPPPSHEAEIRILWLVGCPRPPFEIWKYFFVFFFFFGGGPTTQLSGKSTWVAHTCIYDSVVLLCNIIHVSTGMLVVHHSVQPPPYNNDKWMLLKHYSTKINTH